MSCREQGQGESIRAEYGIDHGTLLAAQTHYVQYCFDELKGPTRDSLDLPKVALPRIVERARYVEAVRVGRGAPAH